MAAFFYSEEENQAHAKHVFGFTRAYNEKTKSAKHGRRETAGFRVKEEENQAHAKRNG